MMHSLLLQIATTNLPTAAPAPVKEAESVFEIAMKGGWILVPITFLSIVAVYVIIDRWAAIIKAKKGGDLVKTIEPLIKEGKIDMAIATCQASNTPAGNVLVAGLKTIGHPVSDVQDAMESEANLQLDSIMKGMQYLTIIASVAPMFGFLGTIFGVIKIFYNISLTDNISIGIISGGLYQKMIASASGLFVGIVAFIGYQLLNASIDKITNIIERQCTQFIALLRSNS